MTMRSREHFSPRKRTSERKTVLRQDVGGRNAADQGRPLVWRPHRSVTTAERLRRRPRVSTCRDTPSDSSDAARGEQFRLMHCTDFSVSANSSQPRAAPSPGRGGVETAGSRTTARGISFIPPRPASRCICVPGSAAGGQVILPQSTAPPRRPSARRGPARAGPRRRVFPIVLAMTSRAYS